MPMDCSIVFQIELLAAVYVKSKKFICSKIITRTVDATQALSCLILTSKSKLEDGGIES